MMRRVVRRSPAVAALAEAACAPLIISSGCGSGRLPDTEHQQAMPGASMAPAARWGLPLRAPLGRPFSMAAQPQEQAPESVTVELDLPTAQPALDELTPSAVVALLDKYIVGQQDAKRAVAVAMRNRWRRQRIPEELRSEVVPKNILMIGPTGCGKTEIARRLAKLADAPFVKVEATKFTEVGFHGRDVDTIIRDLMENSLIHTRAKMKRKLAAEVAAAVEEKLLDLLTGDGRDTTRDAFRDFLRKGQLEDRIVEVENPQTAKINLPADGGDTLNFFAVNKATMVAQVGQVKRDSKKKMQIKEARPLIEAAEMERLIDSDALMGQAISAAETNGIVFIDEIDKIVTSRDSHSHGADASSEGVQRDLLPIIEGSAVSTKHGTINTDFILFICSGAFHSSKPSDMLAELQGRLPIRVELKGLTAKDFYRILTEPQTNMIKQQKALLATEGLEVDFTDEAVHEIARVAEEVNRNLDNIGARRLHTIFEKILEDISFRAPEITAAALAEGSAPKRVIEKDDVTAAVGKLVKQVDLSKYVL